MGRRNHKYVLSMAAASLLAGCVSTTPAVRVVSDSALPAANGGADTAKSAAVLAAEAGLLPATRVGAEVYCKRELMTGSRTKSTETCLTAAQLEKQRNSVNSQLRDIQDLSNGRPTNTGDGSGGRYNSVMTQ